jgi:hypothetical protein
MCLFLQVGSLTQSVEYLPFKQRVARSSRARPTICLLYGYLSPSSSPVQDTGLSRRRHEFKSRWGRHFCSGKQRHAASLFLCPVQLRAARFPPAPVPAQPCRKGALLPAPPGQPLFFSATPPAPAASLRQASPPRDYADKNFCQHSGTPQIPLMLPAAVCMQLIDFTHFYVDFSPKRAYLPIKGETPNKHPREERS